MHEAGVGADEFGEVGQERDDVVLRYGLDFVDSRDVELGLRALVPDGLRRLLGHHADFRHGGRGMCLDLEPDSETGFGLPDAGHFGARVAGDHGEVLRQSV